MSDWQGSARTNYFRVVDMEGIEKAFSHSILISRSIQKSQSM